MTLADIFTAVGAGIAAVGTEIAGGLRVAFTTDLTGWITLPAKDVWLAIWVSVVALVFIPAFILTIREWQRLVARYGWREGSRIHWLEADPQSFL